MEGPGRGNVQFGADEQNGGDVPKSGRLQNSAPAFLVDTWYLGKIKVGSLSSKSIFLSDGLSSKLILPLKQPATDPKMS